MNESSEFAEIEKIEREKKKTPKGQGKIVDFLLAELLKNSHNSNVGKGLRVA